MKRDNRLAWIVVQFQSHREALNLSIQISSVFPNVDIFIVDNDGSMLNQPLDQGVKILRPPKNLGYFGGANFALCFAGWRDYSGVVISNSDLQLRDDFGRVLLDELLDDPTIGWIAPISDNDPVKILTRPPRSTRLMVYSIASLLPFHLRDQPKTKKRVSGHALSFTPRQVFAGSGSLVILSRRYFECGGRLDRFPFLFGEEIELGRRCVSLGLKCIAAFVGGYSHNAHLSTSPNGSRSWSLRLCQAKSQLLLALRGLRDRGRV